MGALTNGEEPEEMLHNMVFHQRKNKIDLKEWKEIQYFVIEIITCHPSIS